MNKAAPDSSPKTLWYVADFVRRTLIEYVLPNCPKPGSDVFPKRDPKKYTESVGRNLLIAGIILDDKKQGMFGGKFDFGPEVEGLAREILGK